MNNLPFSVPVCHEGEYFLQGYCYKQCPVNFYETNTTSSALHNFTGFCSACHESCLRCNGQLESNCISCRDGWTLTNQTICVRLGKASDGMEIASSIKKKDWIRVSIISIIFGCIIVGVLSTMVIIIFIKKDTSRGEYQKYDPDSVDPLLSKGLLENNECSYYDESENSGAPN